MRIIVQSFNMSREMQVTCVKESLQGQTKWLNKYKIMVQKQTNYITKRRYCIRE